MITATVLREEEQEIQALQERAVPAAAWNGKEDRHPLRAAEAMPPAPPAAAVPTHRLPPTPPICRPPAAHQGAETVADITARGRRIWILRKS